ncbi:hypothetical protein K458DRAFT_305729 [Lentithecium fluviatile CBS 122367]|uniref:Uncharacterized protein n=1 Tax=Lentithecium fluviatile CBS 122367 TaxID=1168545 RepID=A0A6G1IZA5_9PLEO|nr:hypothetical protein K458DRAFT_305729 [Lentithecium fluviatile CBS 122367]
MPTQAPAPPVLTIGSSTLTANAATQFFIEPGQTLTPGGSATIDGTVVSLGPSASFVVIGGSTRILPTSTSYMIGSAILTPGGVITVSGSTISLATDGSDIVVNGVTATLHGQTHATITNPPLLTIGSETYTAADGSGTTFVIGSQTLTPGGIITVDGTTINLAPGATELVYGSAGESTTEALFPATATRAVFATGSGSAPASAGATGGDGEPTATSTAVGAGCVLQMSGYRRWIPAMVVGVVGFLA